MVATHPGRICNYCGTVNLAERERCRVCERRLVGTVVPSLVGGDPAIRTRHPLDCLRCGEPLARLGTRELQDLQLEVLACSVCGYVEMGAPSLVGPAYARMLPIPATPEDPEAQTLPLPHDQRDES